jgi:hypothetical protein
MKMPNAKNIHIGLFLVSVLTILYILLRQPASTPAESSFLTILALIDVYALALVLCWYDNPRKTERNIRDILVEIQLFGSFYEFLLIDTGILYAVSIAIILLTPVYLLVVA